MAYDIHQFLKHKTIYTYIYIYKRHRYSFIFWKLNTNFYVFSFCYICILLKMFSLLLFFVPITIIFLKVIKLLCFFIYKIESNPNFMSVQLLTYLSLSYKMFNCQFYHLSLSKKKKTKHMLVTERHIYKFFSFQDIHALLKMLECPCPSLKHLRMVMHMLV